MKLIRARGSVCVVAATCILIAQLANAQSLSQPGVVTIQSDSDKTDPSEGVILKTGDATTLTINPTSAIILSSTTIVRDLQVVNATIIGTTITTEKVAEISSSGVISGTSLSTGTGSITGGAISGTSLSAGTGTIMGGAITGASLSTSGAISGASLSASGEISGASLSASGAITGVSLSTSGAITGASLSTGTGSIAGGAISGTSLSTGSGSITGGAATLGAITGTSLSTGNGSITGGAATLGAITGASLSTGTGSIAGGTATLSGHLSVAEGSIFEKTMDIRGSISNSTGIIVFNDAIKTDNSGGANLVVNEVSGVASLTSGSSGLTVSGTSSTTLKGGINSGILTLQDGNTTGGGAPSGTSITISGSGGGSAATVFQTTTDSDTTTVNTAIGTTAVYTNGSTALLQAGPNNMVSVNSGDSGANPAVSIIGNVTSGSTSTAGVLITGSGQNNQSYTIDDRRTGAIPAWADVAIHSKSFGGVDPALGSAILVSDYGVQILSPQPVDDQKITNNIGNNNSTGTIENNNGLNNGSGDVINNNGGNAGPGRVVNNNGGNTGSGSVTNNIGMNGSSTSGTSTTNIGGVTGNGSAVNAFGDNSSTANGSTTNSFGGNSGSGTSLNNIGLNSSTIGGSSTTNVGSLSGNGSAANTFGGNSSTTGGVVNNAIGANVGNGTSINAFGNASGSGPTTNTIGQNAGSGVMTNNFGGGTGGSINNVGVGAGVSSTTIGSTTVGSTVRTQAGNSTSVMSNGVAVTSVSAGGGVGDSILQNATQQTNGNSGIVLKDATGTHVIVDGNGKLALNSGAAAQTTAAMTITNGLGNTHGFMVNEQQATISGGTQSTSLTLNDSGATFGRSSDGSPVTVRGVANGVNDFDAVNVRQFAGAIAGVTAMASIPSPDAGKTTSVGVGVGHFMSKSAIAFGFNHKMNANSMIKATVASGINGGTKPIVGVGAGWSW
jgi:hypothetical protein